MPQAVPPSGSSVVAENERLRAELDEARRQRDELVLRLAELQAANRGLTARYAQLSEELEETNRGVVALYAELDERSAQVREASEAKSRFLANVSHELRAPVIAVMGLTRLLADSGSDPLTDAQREQVELLNLSATDLLSLVNELLDLAKAESGRLEPRWTEVDLIALFGQLRGTLRAINTRRAIALVVDEPTQVPVLVSDESMLTQVLRNLLTNALKFTEEGEVRLRAEPGDEPGTVRLEVADTGIGIAPEDQERVFEEFFQVPGAQQAQVRGTGLGLPYARRLVALLGGELTLRSTPGQGSVFTVTLPLRAAHPVESRDGGAAEAAVEAVRLRRVLVVDDDASFRLFATRALDRMVDEIEEADDGLRALALVTRRRPDLILLDLHMPEVDGPAVLEVLAGDEALHDIPIVVVSAGLTGAQTGLEHAAAVLDKAGLTPGALAEAVRAAARVVS